MSNLKFANLEEPLAWVRNNTTTHEGKVNGIPYKEKVIGEEKVITLIKQLYENAVFADKLNEFCIKLRKRQQKLEEERKFCKERNLELDRIALQRQIDYLNNIIHEYERFFDLGFVWDESLND